MSAMMKNIYRLLPLKTSTKTFAQVGLHSSAAVQAKVAVVLAGCGVYDGSEVHEASAILVHLSREGAQAQCFAPDRNQLHVINHTKGEPMEETRNCMVEAARIARGNIQSLSNLQAADYDAVIFPGGFGAAKNLCTFAVDGTDMKVDEEVGRVVKAFHQSQKPIGMCCIAPVLAAKLIPGAEVTVGHDQEEGGRWPYAGTATGIQQLGAKHINTSVHQTHTDEKNRIVTTAAFMCETAFHEIYDGIGKLVKDLLKLTK